MYIFRYQKYFIHWIIFIIKNNCDYYEVVKVNISYDSDLNMRFLSSYYFNTDIHSSTPKLTKVSLDKYKIEPLEQA